VSGFNAGVYQASLAAAMMDATPGLHVLPSAVQVLAVDTTESAARRRALSAGVVVDTLVTSGLSDAAAQADATLMSTTVNGGAFQSALQMELLQAANADIAGDGTSSGPASGFASAVVSVSQSGTVVNTPDSAPAPSPSPLPIKSADSQTTVIAVAVVVAAVVVAAVGILYVKFNRRKNSKVRTYRTKPTVHGAPGATTASHVAPNAPTTGAADEGSGPPSPVRVTSYYPWRCTVCGFRNASTHPKCVTCHRGLPPVREGKNVAHTPPLRQSPTTHGGGQLFIRVSSPSPASSRDDIKVEDHH
jgi:hypothetical protein